MSRRTLILIGILTVIAVALIVVAIRLNTQTTTPLPPAPTEEIVVEDEIERTAEISFFPSTVDLTTSNSATVDIVATAGNIPITGAQVQIIYDPTAITNVRLLPPNTATSLFGPAGSYLNLFSDSDPTAGTLEYGIAIQATGNPVVGSGSIGQLSFTKLTTATTPTTQITFGDSTAVVTLNSQQSVLNTTTPLTVTLQ